MVEQARLVVRRPHILVLNQYYLPGVEATAQLLGDLCHALARDADVTVVTGRLRGVAPNAGRSRGGDCVDVIRVNSTAYDRRGLRGRAINYLTYLAQSLREGLSVRKPDIVLCMTDPPVIANVALVIARRFRAPLIVISQDVFPEIAVELKRLENPLVIAALRRAIRFYLTRADRVVAIGETMRQRLEEKGARRDRVRVIPNWVDTARLTPKPHDNAWAREQGLVGRFVVMHSGNVGHAQNLDALIRSATFLRDLDDLRILIIGTGARHAELVALAERLEVEQVVFLPYQPRDVLPDSLSAAHVHVVGLAAGLAGYVVPSRLYGILSVARPVIVAADRASETATVVETVGCGVVVRPGRPDLLARVIRQAHDGELDLDEMGSRAREFVRREADRGVALDRYRELIREVSDLPGGRS
jgi:glycosyltransferase involved in cell wall biosynthesis